jgi:hypothetical protein
MDQSSPPENWNGLEEWVYQKMRRVLPEAKPGFRRSIIAIYEVWLV